MKRIMRTLTLTILLIVITATASWTAWSPTALPIRDAIGELRTDDKPRMRTSRISTGKKNSGPINVDVTDYSESYALVIGNNDYKVRPLKEAVPDAVAIRDMLVENLGWRDENVTLRTNLDSKQLGPAINEFIAKVSSVLNHEFVS